MQKNLTGREKMKAGVQMFTLREFCKTSKDTSETLKKVKEIGFNIIQASGITEPKEVRYHPGT